MEGRTPMVPRKELDTKRQRTQDRPYTEMPRQPSCRARRNSKNYQLVSRQYYWPRMREMIKRYVNNCDMCQRNKVVRHAPYGMLQSNEILDQPWKSIAMDFITDLPNSDGYDKILVVIDRLTMMSHYIPFRKDLDARHFATIFLKEIIRLHDIPRDIIRDRASLFTTELWKHTTEILGIEQR